MTTAIADAKDAVAAAYAELDVNVDGIDANVQSAGPAGTALRDLHSALIALEAGDVDGAAGLISNAAAYIVAADEGAF